jgi:hypothetical protein
MNPKAPLVRPEFLAKMGRFIIFVLFIISFRISIYSINNKMGTHIDKGTSPSGVYTPHDYYTGFPTQIPFKIFIAIVTVTLP